MKIYSMWYKIYVIMGIFIILNSCCKQNKSENQFPRLEGVFMGQESPGMSLTPYLPDIFSVNGLFNFHLHSSLLFSPDGKDIYFTDQDTSNYRKTIYFMSQANGVWLPPEIALFSGKYSDEIGWFSPDGNRLYFTSNRPLNEGEAEGEREGLWLVQKSNEGWTTPIPITSPNDLKWNDGTIYVSANLGNGEGGNDIYMLKYQDGNYTIPMNMGPPINTPFDDYVQCVPNDDSYLIYYRFNPNDKSQRGLYLSFRNKDNSWCKPILLNEIFKLSLDFRAKLSPSEECLFILNRKDGVYWINTQKIKIMNPFE